MTPGASAMDELARDYLLLSLSLGQIEAGIVDAYYGPPELRAEAEARGRPAAQLVEDAASLRQRVEEHERDPQRALWLDRQLVALETLAGRLAGNRLAYVEEVQRCFDARPQATLPSSYEQVREELDELLPPGGNLRERVAQRNERLRVPPERLMPIVAWLLEEVRRDCLAVFAAPEGESLALSMVSDQPWSAYNWYDGELHSRIEFNTDLPARAHELISLVTHEAFPGHHLEHAWKETRLVREQGKYEASVQLINTPEAYISEGLAELGGSYVVDATRWQQLFAEICQRAGIPADQAQPEVEWRTAQALRGLRAVGADAALMLHADGKPGAQVLAFLEQTGLRSREQAEKNLDFISHPLWRTYVFCYSGGERLLGRWCAAAGDRAAQQQRFFRLLNEQLTPSYIAADLAKERIHA